MGSVEYNRGYREALRDIDDWICDQPIEFGSYVITPKMLDEFMEDHTPAVGIPV